jgi:hypothetical protein
MDTQAVTFDYNEVERALAKAFGIRKEAMGALRGRLNNFRKLGLVADSPGTGRKVSYRREHIYKWALGLELCEFGVDPRLIRPFVNLFAWPKAKEQLLRDGGPEDGYQLLCFYPSSLSQWGHYVNEETPTGGLLTQLVGSLSQLEQRLRQERERRHRTGTVHYETLYGRLGMINLAQLRLRIEDALANPD